MELVIMAAGMGSRFGGLKQIEPVGPSGEFILDYSIFDAVRSGLDKVIFIIKEENLEIFKETVGKRIEKKIKVEYVFQDIKDVPDNANIPEDRVKPLGTGHALYCARDKITGPFVVISSDDFYGREAMEEAAESIKDGEEHSVIGYQIGNTITENGAVKRGVCFEKDGYLTSIIESKVERINGTITCNPLDGREEFTVEDNHPVSMLFFGLQKDVIDYLKKDIVNFFDTLEDRETGEYLLPDVLDKMMQEGLKIKVVPTKSTWRGVTYKEDLEGFKEYINKEIEEGKYPANLWE